MICFTVFLVLAGTALSSVSGHVIPQNCSADYQSALREALDIKEECGDAAAYDCCQVGVVSTQVINSRPLVHIRTLAHAATCMYESHEVCPYITTHTACK